MLHVATLNTNRLSLAALAALAETTRHAVGWPCYSPATRLELQGLADALDADLARRRDAFRARVVRRWPA